jgi:hypothetical protein
MKGASMSERRPPAERRHRQLLFVLVLLAVLHPLWSRVVEWLWPPPDAPAPAVVMPIDAGPMAAPLPVEPPAAPEVAAAAEPPVETIVLPAEAPPAPVQPTVLGASIGAAAEVQVLVDLHGREDLSALLAEICLQAQLFVERPLSGQRIRLHSQFGDAPAEDIGLHRCP